MNISIRPGTLADLPQVYALIQELAVFEKAPQEVTNTLAELQEDGFGANPVYEFLVAEADDTVVGLCLYYMAYSTWKGRMLYLEDLVITETYRRYGIGKKLFRAFAKRALDLQVKRLKWQVLEWNEPAIKFYRSLNANLDAEWVNCNMTAEQIAAYVAVNG
ncbi:GNAT family N-acetyltransferase [Adhaeribacter pallidiroseus]|uniref:Diamine N-acetyltransferase n=1 Tax=Adhaeribacter pallidiroseus TaxID=2072847 RepID=A0A369QRP1_9BACT|nr:GNAT family N-acetyltransferase [Adhaeribacter pallidiroseus]RDC65986.1 Diamine N-acetyltransferase [Adhaeribacter pallidiroseus]